MGQSSAVILFDLGNTLVEYYELAAFPGILRSAISETTNYLRQHGIVDRPQDELEQRVAAENHEALNYEVRPLEQRLRRIFSIDSDDPLLIDGACRAFMRPIFGLALVYSDVLPVLEDLRGAGYRTGIISNTPWGSPASLWLEETARLGLNDCVDEVIFCRDAGWRKPARQIFDHALQRFGAGPEQCVFIGDDPRWDIAGPETMGMRPILIDRTGTSTHPCHTIRSLHELPALLATRC